MKRMRLLLFAVMVAAGAWPAPAQQVSPPMHHGVNWNYGLETSYTADSELKQGATRWGDFNLTQVRASATAVWSPSECYSWGLGPVFDFSNFGAAADTPVPGAAYGLALRLNSNWRFADRWTLRLDARPGVYSDLKDVSWDDFNMPVLVALGYEVNTNLLLMLGLNVNLRSALATIGGPGLRWRFAEDWTLNLFLPKPTLEYALTRAVTLYGGGEWRGGACRVAENFGTQRGQPGLDNNDFSYRELRALGGVRFQAGRVFRVALEAGYAFQQRIEFRQADETLDGGGAPFVQLVASGSF